MFFFFFFYFPCLSCNHSSHGVMSIRFNSYFCVKSVEIRSFSWSVFSCFLTEYGDLWSKSLYSVRIQENMDQKKLRIWTLFRQSTISSLPGTKQSSLPSSEKLLRHPSFGLRPSSLTLQKKG